MDNVALLKMLQVSDSLFPIGAYTLSNGLETFVSNGEISNNEDLQRYVESFMGILPYNDLGVMMLAFHHYDDMEYIRQLDEISIALKIPSEIRSGSKRLCRRFLKIWDDIREYPALCKYHGMMKTGGCQGNHAIAVGLYVKDIGLDCNIGACIYSYNLINTMVVNAVKLVPLSQTAGQRILNKALEHIEDCVEMAAMVELNDLGVSGTIFDIAAMNHEILYSRLYMS